MVQALVAEGGTSWSISSFATQSRRTWRARSGQGDLAGRGREEQPRPHRRHQSEAQLLLFRLSGGGAAEGARGRGGGDGRQAARPPARRAHRHQGPDADQGQAHHARQLQPRALGARTTTPPSSRSSPAAGAIMVGKTTTPEFAYSSFTESPLWGITRNPWNPERTPGGSSGGSGAAVGERLRAAGRRHGHGRLGAHSRRRGAASSG